MHRSIPLVGAALLVVVAASGCGSKKDLDKMVDRLVAAAQGGDYAAFKEISHPSLVENFPEEKFTQLAGALSLLGPLKDRTMKSISVKSGAPSEGKYTLEFEKGELELQLAEMDGKLVEFNFSGDDLTRALNDSTFKEFKIRQFEFLDGDKGNPVTGNVFAPGPVYFRAAVQGLARREGAMHLQVALRLLSGDRVLFEKLDMIDERSEVPPEAPRLGDFSGSLQVPTPGSYLLQLKVHDAMADKTIDFEQAFVIK